MSSFASSTLTRYKCTIINWTKVTIISNEVAIGTCCGIHLKYDTCAQKTVKWCLPWINGCSNVLLVNSWQRKVVCQSTCIKEWLQYYVYDDASVDVITIRTWARTVTGDNPAMMNLYDHARSGQLITTMDMQHQAWVDKLNHASCHAKQKDIAVMLGILNERVRHIIH